MARSIPCASVLVSPLYYKPSVHMACFGTFCVRKEGRVAMIVFCARTHSVVGCKIPRKENTPIFRFFSRPPVPVSPGLPEDDPTIDKNKRPGLKIGLIETFSRVYPKKACTRRVNRKIADSTRNQRVFFSRYLAANHV